MREPLKIFLRVAGVVVGLGAAAWALRDKLLPAPAIPEGPPPKFRTPSTPPAAKSGPDDLTKVKGIGPVYAKRLAAAGFETFAGLASADAAAVGTAAGVSSDTATKWVKAAAQL
jgi:predicted flap endonuclease-1-like 5' DNA nuclease